ncbi:MULTISPECIES: substrate-binding periplasmic protein [Deefgea]|uniref:Transporter substrate-binding domain-containing protein n=1 Tax=Deefgea chitinilytica TaxID=570276 RepID=A0ABS2CD45_9NEIS|nr:MULTISPECIES: transporter substrate-binding domain-containing protein [Deefgea]MBM5572045.1 transporter substrate-binding domain-containing protein [Deefgea chitinilytica]MBM9889280.1 transporter substrate-binding domain-containing protein [Deefgea sp. CFH1-16]
MPKTKALFIFMMCVASNVIAAPQCPAMIKVAFYDFGLLYSAGKGIDRDVIDELKQRTGCHFVSTVLPRARIWKDLESGEIAMSVSGIQNPAREQFAWFAPYLNIKNISVISKNLSTTINSFEDFLNTPSLQWGAVRAFKHGETQDQFLTQLREQNRLLETASAEQLFELLKAGRIHGLFSQSPVYGYYIPKLGMPHLISIHDWAPLEKPVPHGLILSKKHFTASEAEQWKNIIQTMNTDGTMQRILGQYLTHTEVKKTLHNSP